VLDQSHVQEAREHIVNVPPRWNPNLIFLLFYYSLILLTSSLLILLSNFQTRYLRV